MQRCDVAYLFVRVEHAHDLESFSKKVFALLNVAIKETRHSDNWPGGRYVLAETLGLEIRLTLADDSDFPDYHFWITFEPQVGWGDDIHSLDGLADAIAKHLAPHGMKIARPLSPNAGAGSVVYGDNAT
jgi:hypothetical protein